MASRKKKPTKAPPSDAGLVSKLEAELAADDELRKAASQLADKAELPPDDQDPHVPVPRTGISQSRLHRVRMLAAERARRDFELIKLYEPQPTQEKFHKCKAPRVVIRGGNRSGKTTAAFMELARAVTGQDPYNKYPKRDGIAVVIGYDEKHCKNVVYPRLFKSDRSLKMIRDLKTGRWRLYRRWEDEDRAAEARPAPPLIPPRMIKEIAWINKGERVFSVVRLKNGWEIHFYSSKGAPPQGFWADFILIDEDVENPEWLGEMESRLADQGGRLIWAALPKSRNHALLTFSRRAWAEAGNEDPDVVEFVLRFRDNAHIGVKERALAIKGWEALGDEELRMRDFGEYTLDQYKVFPEFSAVTHCIDLTSPELVAGRLPDNWCRYAIIDPGYQVCAVLFVAIPPPDFKINNKSGDWVYLEDELYMRNCSLKTFGENMVAKTMGKCFQAFVIDNHGSARSESNGKTIRRQFSETLEKYGVSSVETGHGFRLGSSDKQGRIMAVHTWLAPRRDGGPPKLRVLADRMPNFLMEMEGYFKRRGGKGGKEVLDEPDDRKANHLMHCLQYAAHYTGLRYVEPESPGRPKNPVVEAFRKKQRKKRQGRSKYILLGPGKAA